MKKVLLNLTLILLSVMAISSCDNGFADVDVIDTPPTITLGSITSGTTEGQDFKIKITVSDGVEGSTISALRDLTYTITSGGATVASGTEALTGDNQVIDLVISGGFPAGDYNFDAVVTDTNGNSTAANRSFTVASLKPAFDITGAWTMEPVAGAMKVGPAPGDGQWWTSGAGEVTARACFFDDVYTFNADGSFEIDMGAQTWLEQWQGVANDGCGAPIAPFDGKGTYSYTYTTTTLTLVGTGAHVGLSKVNNAGEISQGAAVADEISYTIADQSESEGIRRMTLRIEAGSGVWWDFRLISGTPATATSVVGNWKMEPVAGALAVGSSEGASDYWANGAGDVTARACFFDDVYTFNADGTFTMDMGSQTWLEAWQGVAADACGAPIAPHDGKGSYTYEFAGGNLKIIGKGGHVALAKVVNGAELPSVGVPDEITYKVASLTEEGGKKKMTLHIEVGGGAWWTFRLVSE
ncbi:hypothetical protein [Algoriphagus algorifonticola]|uniref:hypothetical protein n=1 Tax=Algoriphagus algorifonticola TaxID=2593007 RepID=UPI0011A3E6D2|nr:hypothetical protein [Algoriphagus algorifonticola]